jgi:tetratricopeptide (TPR) repeat protein
MKRVTAAILLMVLFGACNPKQSWKRNAIETAEKKLMEDAKAGKVDTAAVSTLLAEYESYSETSPSDTLGAAYLFKAADFYRYMRKPLKSIGVYEKIYERYPTVGKHPYALFLQGFIFENEVGNPHAAKLLYEKFLEKYPTHPIAKDVRATLSNLGKTPEQLVAEFQARIQQDSLAEAEK